MKKKIKTKKSSPPILILMTFSILFPISGCSFFKNAEKIKESQESNARKPIEWQQLKGYYLSSENPTIDDVNNLMAAVNAHGFTVQTNEVAEVVDAIRISKNPDVKLRLLTAISSFVKEEPSVLPLVKDLAASEDRLLAPEALRILIDSEITRDANGQDQWETWHWSREVKALLEQASNRNLYKLSAIDNHLALLRLANRYPNSKLVEGARAYGRLTGGESYFGPYVNLPDDQVKPVLRIPFNPKLELAAWPEFLLKYPDHPASDDAMYRIARAYEIQGEYGKAAISYYKASQMPDRALSGVANARVLFIFDLLMDSESLTKLIEKTETPYQELLPILEYSRAVHLIRENNLSSAIFELEKFVNSYKTKTIKDLTYEVKTGVKFDSHFWENVERQIEDLKELEDIKRKPISDKRLYEEASFWFYNYLTAYNYLQDGRETFDFEWFIPSAWEGNKTSIERSLRYEFVQNASRGYDSQVGYLISISIFQNLLKDYPNSSLAEKAKYSIILNYYYLNQEHWAVSLEQSSDWRKYAIENAYEFIEQFPKSSMSDDALLTIGEIGDPLTRINALEKLFGDYPNTDRGKSARSLLEAAKSELANSEREDGIIAVGLQLEERKSGWLNLSSEVFISGIKPYSSAVQSGLTPGDTILEVDGRSVANSIDVKAYIRSHNPGETVQFKVRRGEKVLKIDVIAELVPK